MSTGPPGDQAGDDAGGVDRDEQYQRDPHVRGERGRVEDGPEHGHRQQRAGLPRVFCSPDPRPACSGGVAATTSDVTADSTNVLATPVHSSPATMYGYGVRSPTVANRAAPTPLHVKPATNIGR